MSSKEPDTIKIECNAHSSTSPKSQLNFMSQDVFNSQYRQQAQNLLLMNQQNSYQPYQITHPSCFPAFYNPHFQQQDLHLLHYINQPQTQNLFNNDSILLPPYHQYNYPNSFSAVKKTTKQQESVEQIIMVDQAIQVDSGRIRIDHCQDLDINLKEVTRDKIEIQKVDEIKFEVLKAVNYLMDNLKIQEDIFVLEYTKQFKHSPYRKELKIMFKLLFSRYLQCSKTKEEMIKFIIRKCFKENRKKNETNQKNNLDSQLMHYSSQIDDADKFYFKQREKFITNEEMKKMNNPFLDSLFKSAAFRQDYEDYLENYQTIARSENYKKIVKLVDEILVRLEKNEIQSIKNISRFPWLQFWLNQSYEIAKQMLEPNKILTTAGRSKNLQRNKSK